MLWTRYRYDEQDIGIRRAGGYRRGHLGFQSAFSKATSRQMGVRNLEVSQTLTVQHSPHWTSSTSTHWSSLEMQHLGPHPRPPASASAF